MNRKILTVGELRKQIANMPDDLRVMIEGCDCAEWAYKAEQDDGFIATDDYGMNRYGQTQPGCFIWRIDSRDLPEGTQARESRR